LSQASTQEAIGYSNSYPWAFPQSIHTHAGTVLQIRPRQILPRLVQHKNGWSWTRTTPYANVLGVILG
jgi:hypothetical protein